MAGVKPVREPKGYELVEARHIDALTSSVRALNTTITKTEIARAKDALAAAAREQRLLVALELIAKHTENLPALMDLLVTQRTNGQGHAPEETETT